MEIDPALQHEYDKCKYLPERIDVQNKIKIRTQIKILQESLNFYDSADIINSKIFPILSTMDQNIKNRIKKLQTQFNSMELNPTPETHKSTNTNIKRVEWIHGGVHIKVGLGLVYCKNCAYKTSAPIRYCLFANGYRMGSDYDNTVRCGTNAYPKISKCIEDIVESDWTLNMGLIFRMK